MLKQKITQYFWSIIDNLAVLMVAHCERSWTRKTSIGEGSSVRLFPKKVGNEAVKLQCPPGRDCRNHTQAPRVCSVWMSDQNDRAREDTANNLALSESKKVAGLV